MGAFEVTGAGVILAVADVGRSVSFYRDLLGFTVDALYNDPPYAVLSRAGMRLSLAEQGHGAPDHDVVMRTPQDRSTAQAMLVLEVDDAAAVHEQLARAGADLVAPLYSPPWGGHRFFVRDPDGFLVEVEQLS